jgi:hypothetical protein
MCKQWTASARAQISRFRSAIITRSHRLQKYWSGKRLGCRTISCCSSIGAPAASPRDILDVQLLHEQQAVGVAQYSATTPFTTLSVVAPVKMIDNLQLHQKRRKVASRVRPRLARAGRVVVRSPAFSASVCAIQRFSAPLKSRQGGRGSQTGRGKRGLGDINSSAEGFFT